MPVTYFHDGRILIVTLAAEATPEDVQAVADAARANGEIRRAPVLVDVRGQDGADFDGRLAARLCQLVSGLDRAPRFAVLQDERDTELAYWDVLARLAAEQGAEALAFRNLGLALRWLWWLDDLAAVTHAERGSGLARAVGRRARDLLRLG